MRAIASLGCEGAMRAIASSISPTSPPGRVPHTYILCRNPRRHNNCSNLGQDHREDNANDPSS
jgi:hypothetical protein